MKRNANNILRVARDRGLVRARDLVSDGYNRETIRRLVAEGLLVQRGRGIYAPADSLPTEHDTLVTISLRIPHAVICLLSALRFHNLTTQNPSDVWIAIDRKAWAPKTDLPIRVVRFSGPALTEGVETHTRDGIDIRVYTPAKTVADCFKYRHKIGIDVALEALRDCREKRLATMDDIWRSARICRVTNVMRPYLEAIAT